MLAEVYPSQGRKNSPFSQKSPGTEESFLSLFTQGRLFFGMVRSFHEEPKLVR